MELVCPECRTPLQFSAALPGEGDPDGFWRCAACQAAYHQRHGIVCFLEAEDAFYEGRFAGSLDRIAPDTALGRMLLPLRLACSLELHYPRLLRRFLRPEYRRVLDLGCGGGHAEVSARGAAEVVGLDLSFASLRAARVLYAGTVMASASRLPFPDGYFDAVVSSNFLGHIALEEKDAVLGEMARVVRPGGLLLHQMETSSEGALFRFARRDAEFYRKWFIELDGHVGLETPGASLERFRRHGFDVLSARPEYAWYFVPQGEALKRFDNGYARRNAILRGLVRLDRLLERHARLRKGADLVLGALNEAVCALAPLDRCCGLCVALRKRAS